METVCVKFEKSFLQTIEKTMQKHHYATKAEFFREAARDKIKELEKEKLLQKLEHLQGSSKRRTTDKQLHKAGEQAFARLEKKFNLK